MLNKLYKTRTGIRRYLSSGLRTATLKECASKRGDQLNLLRHFIEYNRIDKKASLEEISKTLELNSGTLGRLERGETCLAIDIAPWIARQVLRMYGIYVHPAWLLALTEEGAPTIIETDDIKLIQVLEDIIEEEYSKLSKKHDLSGKTNIFSLQKVCALLFPEMIQICVQDDLMSDIFDIGDIVVGKLVQDDFDKINRSKCIIQFKKTKETLIRFVTIVDETQILLTCYKSAIENSFVKINDVNIYFIHHVFSLYEEKPHGYNVFNKVMQPITY